MPVKCSDCGFLAVQDEYTDLVGMASARTRESGTHQSSSGIPAKAKFLCHLDCLAFPGPTEQPADAISQPIECDLFRKWIPSKSPKEHEEMSLLQMVEAENKRSRDELEKIAERRHQENLRATQWALAVAIISAIFSALVAVYVAVLTRS